MFGQTGLGKRLRGSLLLLGIIAFFSIAGEGPQHADAAPDEVSPHQRAFDGLKDWVVQHGGALSAHVVPVHGGSSWLEHQPSRALNPASNMKVVTAAVALDVLGPDYRFQTGLYGHIDEGRVERLVLRGEGDPSLREQDLWRLANALARRGITQVDTLLVDHSAFDEQYVPPAFEQQPDEWSTFRSPVSAIALERNTVTLNVMPTKNGVDARHWFEPVGVVRSRGHIETKKVGQGNRVQLRMEAEPAGLLAVVGGHIAEGLPRQRYSKRLADPRLAPGANLAQHLKQAGIKVGKVALGGQDETRRITYVSSPPLAELLKELGKHSDNFYAETLFKVLSREQGDPPRTFSGGQKTVSQWLERHRASSEGTQIKNGSGLFDANRLSAQSLTTTLQVAYRSPRLRNEFVTHLAIAGVDGTLRSRLRALRESRSVRAKTGTLRDTIALSGYVLRPSAPPLAFSFLVNGIAGQHGAIRSRIDKVVQALAEAEAD